VLGVAEAIEATDVELWFKKVADGVLEKILPVESDNEIVVELATCGGGDK
jgi:hypothetical protein